MHETKNNSDPSTKNHFVTKNSSSKPVSNEILSNNLRSKIVSSSIIIIYSAAAVGSSTILLIIPNFETISLFIFFVSMRFGAKIGFQMMITTTIIFELFASAIYGFGSWLFVFKFISYSIFVLLAGILYKRDLYKEIIYNNSINSQKYLYSFLFFFIGYSLTIIYDLITTMSIIFILPSFSLIIANLIYGIPFFIFHEFTNGLLFSLIPSIIVLMEKSSIHGKY